MGIKMFKTPEELQRAWEDYKRSCDCRRVTRTEFLLKLGQFCTQDVPSSVTYTIEGFCVHVHLARSAFTSTMMALSESVRRGSDARRVRSRCARKILRRCPACSACRPVDESLMDIRPRLRCMMSQLRKSMDNIENMVKQLSEVEDDDVAE